jgi:hypothetical protein
MARVAVIGEPLRINGYGLPGAILCPATDQAEAVLAWRDLPDEIDVAVLTPSAARWLASEIARRPRVLPVLLAEMPAMQPLAREDVLPGATLEPGRLAEPGALAGPGSRAGQEASAGPGQVAEPGPLAGPVSGAKPPLPRVRGREPQS